MAEDPGLADFQALEARRARHRYPPTGTPNGQKPKRPKRNVGDIEFSEDVLALEYAHRHAHELRYVADWGAWLLWGGARWGRERTLKAFDMARVVARDAVGRGGDPKRLLSAKTIAAIERLAESDRALTAVPQQWDAEDWSFNSPHPGESS